MTSPRNEPVTEDWLASLDSMEGIYSLPAVEIQSPSARVVVPPPSVWPGYQLAAVTAVIGYAIHYLPFAPFMVASPAGVRRPVSSAIAAIVAGVLIRNVLPVPGSILEGCKVIVRKMIPLTIVLTGAGLNLALFGTIGLATISITVLCILISLLAAQAIGRMLGLWPRTSLLIGVGTAICGNSAIVAVAPLIDASEEDVALSVGTVNLLGLLCMLLLPSLGGLLHLSDQAFGVWAGSTIHAVPQVVAAAFAYSQNAGTLATLVKLVRVTLLAPLVIVLSLVYARRDRGKLTVHYSRLVPSFVWGFMVLALVNTMGLIPTLQFHVASWVPGAGGGFQVAGSSLVSEMETLLLTLAMAAMGLEVGLRRMLHVGSLALLTGTGAAIVLILASLGLIKVFL
ncbi:MAG TPA: putative sulfate exporter family transporter [Bryobacteraceae bacterium]|nr:putative sulfate exporter family transporter [Bryobacteraceae bacterium]